MDVLILGGTRFVGYHLALDLLQRGHRVMVLNRGVTRDELPADIERLRADRTLAGALQVSVAGRDFEAVVDMSAYRGADTREALEAFAGRTGHYVHISTGQVYLVRTPPVPEPAVEEAYDGAVIAPPGEDDPEYGSWLYGVEKRECEDLLRDARDFPATVLRLPMVQGERDHFRRTHAYVARLLDGGPILVPDAPNRLLRHVYYADVVRAIRDLLESGTGKGRVYNLSQDEAITLQEFLAILGGALGVEPRCVVAPRARLEREGLLPDCSPFSGRSMSIIDNSRAKRELGCGFTGPAEYLPTVARRCLETAPDEVPGYSQRVRELGVSSEIGA